MVDISSHTCTVYWFAGLLLLGARHAPLPTDVRWGALATKHTSVFRPGAAASATADFCAVVPGVGDVMIFSATKFHVTVKFLKRQCFGRAKFALLRKRILLTP